MIVLNRQFLILCCILAFSLRIAKSDETFDLVNGTSATKDSKVSNVTTEISQISESPTTATNFEDDESTTPTTPTTSTSSTSSTSSTTSTIAPSEHETNQNSTGEKSFLCGENAERLNKFYKMFTPILLRFAFGMAVDLKEVTRVLKCPIGLGIAFFCNFFFMPLSSYIFGWIFFADHAGHRLSLFSGGGVTSTRLQGVFSNCWTVVLGGNVELSVVMSITVVIFSTMIHSKWLFSIGEQLFGSNTLVNTSDVEVDVYYILLTLGSTIIPFLIGIFVQMTFVSTKKYARTMVDRALFSYILSNFVIMTGYTVVNLMYSDISIKLHLLDLLLPILRYLTGFFFAKVLKQKYEAIAVESTVPRQNASTSIPMVVQFIVDKIKAARNETQTPEIRDQIMYQSCPSDLPKVLRVNLDGIE